MYHKGHKRTQKYVNMEWMLSVGDHAWRLQFV